MISNSRSVLDRSADALIGAASADIARHGGVDVVIRRLRRVLQQRRPGAIGRSRPIWTAPAGRVHRWARVAPGRTRMIGLVGWKAATASSRVAMLPMFVRSRPSRTRWTI